MAVTRDTGAGGGTNWEDAWRARLATQMAHAQAAKKPLWHDAPQRIYQKQAIKNAVPVIRNAISSVGAGSAGASAGSAAAPTPIQQLNVAPSAGGAAATAASTPAASASRQPASDQSWRIPNVKVASGNIPLRSWFDDTVMAALGPLARDPAQVNYQWSRSKGYGRGVEGLLGQYADPYAMALASGQVDPSLNDEYLKYVGGFNEQALTGYGNAVKFNPRSIIQRVLSATGDVNVDPSVKGAAPDKLGQMLFGGVNATDPAAQVDTTLKFLESSLTGLMSPVALDSYLNMLAEQGRAFIQYKYSEKGATTPFNFGNWILDRLGANGGL